MKETGNASKAPDIYHRLPIREEVPADAVALALYTDGEGCLTRLVWQSEQGQQEETGPRSVPSALRHAQMRAAELGKGRVVVCLEPGVVWDDSWGQLRTVQMQREPMGDLTTAMPTDKRQLQDEEYFTAALIQELERDA